MEYTITFEFTQHNIIIKAIKDNDIYQGSVHNNDIYRYVLNNIKTIKITYFVIDNKLYMQCSNICTISLNQITNYNEFKIISAIDNNDERQIYIDGKQCYIRDILYSIKKYNIEKLKSNLNNIHDITIYMINEMNEKINELINIPFDLVHFGINDKLSILPLFKKNQILNFNTIIKCIYDYELNALNRFIVNHSITKCSNHDLLINEISPFEYITINSIVDRLSKTIQNDSNKMNQLREMIMDNIYYDYICKKNYNNISEIKLKALYKYFDIKAIKLVANTESIESFDTKFNVLLPIKFISNKLDKIIANSNRVNELVFIE
jgi:hypothetical protein